MLPAEAGRFDGEPAERVFRASIISKVDPTAPTGVKVERDFFTGKTAKAYEFSKPCYQ